MTNDTNLNANVLASFQNRVNTITTERQTWQTTQFNTANEALYKLLGDIYTLYDEAKGDTEADQKKREWLLAECTAKKLPLNKKPSFIQMLVKFIFSDNDTDSRRISSYTRVLSAAAQSDDVKVGADVPNFIRKYGGVEEIRASLSKNTKTPKQRAQMGRGIALNKASIVEVSSDVTLEHAASLKNQAVLLVGFVNAQGKVDVKHICFENGVEKTLIGAKTAVNAALSNLYTQTEKERKAAEDQKATEKATDDKNTKALEAAESVAEEPVVQTAIAA